MQAGFGHDEAAHNRLFLVEGERVAEDVGHPDPGREAERGAFGLAWDAAFALACPGPFAAAFRGIREAAFAGAPAGRPATFAALAGRVVFRAGVVRVFVAFFAIASSPVRQTISSISASGSTTRSITSYANFAPSAPSTLR